MGTWGVKIFQNDDAADLRDTYREKIIVGFSDDEAEKATIQEFSSANGFDLWLPLAMSQWNIGRLSESVKANALLEIDKELSSMEELWKAELVSKRKQELEAAREVICSQQPEKKKLRKPWWAWKCPWQPGSVLQFKITHPNENNPYLAHYVMLQLLGAYETPPGKIPCEVINVALYLWHSEASPMDQMEALEANPPRLSGFVTSAGTIKEWWCIMPHVRENEIKCVRKSPFCSDELERITHNAANNTTFQEAICRTLKERA